MTNNGIQIENSPNILIITDSDQNQITVTQPVVSLVEVSAVGPQGQKGDQGDSIFQLVSGSVYSTTSSLEVSGSFTVSGSSTFKNIGPAIFSGSVTSTQGFTGSLFGSSSYALTASYAMNGGSGGGGFYIATGSVSASVGLGTGSFEVTSGSSTLFTVDNTGAISASAALITGNVTVLGTASINTLIVNQTQLSTGSNQLGDAANDFQTLYGTVTIPTGSLTVTGSTIISSSAATQLQVGNDLLFVSSSGRVGIGTTTPSFAFEVKKTTTDAWIAASRGSNTVHAGLLVIPSGSWSNTNLLWNFALYANTNDLRYWGWNGLNDKIMMSLFGNTGNMVIAGGTLSVADAGFRLDVNGTGRFSGNLTITGSATNSLLVKGSGATSGTTGFVIQDSSGTDNFKVRDDGYITLRGYQTMFLGGNYVLDNQFNLNIRTGGTVIVSNGASSNWNASAVFKLDSTTQGFLPTRTNLLSNISNPAQGLITYLTSSGNEGLYYYNSGSYQGWTEILNNSGSQNITGSLSILGAASTSSAALLVYKSGSTVVDVQGSSGQLFSITDSLTGSLFSVNTVAGLPVVEAFSDNTVNIGKFGVYPIKVAATGTLAIITGSLFGSATTASYVNPLTQSVNISGGLNIVGTGINLTGPGPNIGSTAGNVYLTSNSLTIRSTILNDSGDVKIDDNLVIGQNTNGTARLQVKGSGTTSATTALLVQNANASSSLAVLDNGYVGINTGSAQYNLDVNGTVRVKGTGTTSATNAFTVQNSAGTELLRVRDDGNLYFQNSLVAIGASGYLNTQYLEVQNGSILKGDTIVGGTITTAKFQVTGAKTAASSIARGVYFNNTLVAAANNDVLVGLDIQPTFNTGSFTNVNRLALRTTGNTYISGSSGNASALTVYKSGSTVMSIQGSQGELFSITDSLSGSLFSVSNISGLPIVEVFSDDSIVMGNYATPAMVITGSSVSVATASAAPTGTAAEGTFRFAVVGGAYYIYAYLGGAWRSGSLT